MEQMKILSETQELIDLLLDSDEIKRFKEIEHEMNENEELKRKIVSFHQINEKYQEARKYGKYHPNLKEYQQQLLDEKQALFNDPLFNEYKDYELKVDMLLTELSNVFQEVIGTEEKACYSHHGK
jgi:cell fate (sporulation/competence/biofilm development) regulator YlbF (YheA/YmcA/DUF963 family)